MKNEYKKEIKEDKGCLIRKSSGINILPNWTIDIKKNARTYPLEKELQKKVIQYLENRGLLFQVSFTGIKTKNIAQAIAMKNQGMRAGIPDIFISELTFDKIELVFKAGLYLELKTEKGRLSDAQKKYIEKLKDKKYSVYIGNQVVDVSYDVEVAYGFDDAIAKINNYLNKIKI